MADIINKIYKDDIMRKDKPRDDENFNCSEEHEFDYVSSLYNDTEEVRKFLKDKCKSGDINYSTHKEVYELIEKELGFPIPN
jgi:tryptophanyl-tRNA synthetase